MNENKNVITAGRHILKTLYKKDLSDLDISKLSQTEVTDIKKTILNQFVGAYPYIIQWGLHLYSHSKELLKQTENDFYIELPKNDLLKSILSYPMNQGQKFFVWNEILKLNQLSQNKEKKELELFRFFINKDNQVVRDIPLRVALNFGDVDKVLNYKKLNKNNANSIKNIIKRIETITIYFNKQFFSDNITGSFFKIPREFYATSKTIIELVDTYNKEVYMLNLDNNKDNINNISAQKICNLIYYFNDIWTGNKDNSNNIKMLTTNKQEEPLNRYLDIAANIFREHYREGKVINQKALKNDIQTCIEIYKKCLSISIIKPLNVGDEIVQLPVDMIPDKVQGDFISMYKNDNAYTDIIGNISFFNILLYRYFIQENICDLKIIPQNYNHMPYSKNLIKHINKLIKPYTKKQLVNLANELVIATNLWVKRTSNRTINKEMEAAILKAHNTTLKILRDFS